MDHFRCELEYLLNKCNKDKELNTADFILAEYLTRCLSTLKQAIELAETDSFFILEFLNRQLTDVETVFIERNARQDHQKRHLELVSTAEHTKNKSS